MREKPTFRPLPISLVKNVITTGARGRACELRGAADESDCGQVQERRRATAVMMTQVSEQVDYFLFFSNSFRSHLDMSQQEAQGS